MNCFKNYNVCTIILEYCSVADILVPGMANNTVQYGAIIYSKENMTTVENTLNDNFQKAAETDNFTEDAIHDQIATLTQIISNGPKFTKGEISVISLFSIFAAIILATGVMLFLAKDCNTGAVVVFITALILISVSGPLIYFAIDDALSWDVSGSVVGTVSFISICIFISVFVGLCDR